MTTAPLDNVYQRHPLREAVGVLGKLSPSEQEAVLSAAQRAFLREMSKRASSPDAAERLGGAPRLVEPRYEVALSGAEGGMGGAKEAATPGRSGVATLTEVLAVLESTATSDSVNQLKLNARMWNELSAAIKNTLEQLSLEAAAANNVAHEATQAASQAAGNVAQAVQAEKMADKALDEARRALADAQRRGASAADIQKCRSAVDDAQAVANAAKFHTMTERAAAAAAADDAATKAHRAVEAESKANSAVQDAMRQLGPGSPVVRQAERERFGGEAELTRILGELSALMSKGSVLELETQQKLFTEMQARRQEAMRKKSDEYQAQVRKAEEMQKTMGCIGKTLGWVITAMGVAAAVFTGGASLALVAVGLALVIGDQVVKAATGFSIIDKLMQPVMAILKPLMSLVSDAIASVLEAFGVNSDTAQFVGSIIGAVITGVALVAAAVLGVTLVRAVAQRVADVMASHLTRTLDSTMVKTLMEAIENSGLKSLAARAEVLMGRLGKAVGIETEAGTLLVANRIERASIALNMGNQVSQAVGDVVIGMEEKRAMNLMAEIKRALCDSRLIGDLLRQAVETFAAQNQVLTQLMQEMSNSMAAQVSAGEQVLRNARAV
ncbi:Cell invasion protein SipB [Pandoraea horticolens]|uniref:Cell invasion protein SipB n=2 Tax=Pandoraea horticolens TaxID=2508298 RepID=A0A5E4XL10_9BURK|nr:Cell invasion protein SipB [Pandoraea horticolens]